ncbi:hypothetical protein [Methylophilus sp.]|uniref:hypothetical protein n=1 Tax=Methylophilus sp. TaxID=29541 RepID=UPI0011DBF55B|nr:hypothetical protein [Methylophilus sp.]TXI47679.1 MAG: hypothetical protein E6Q52_00215 [Methylophilus sp.]
MSDYWPEKRFFMSGIKGLIDRFLSVAACSLLRNAKTKNIYLYKTDTYQINKLFLHGRPKVLVWPVVNRVSTNSFY